VNTPYRFLPFRFKRFGQSVLLVNDIGEFQFLEQNQFESFVNKSLEATSDIFLNLQSKHMAVTDDQLPQMIDHLATAYRTKKRYLYDFTSLHMFVVTHRCNQQCSYCHASSISDDNSLHDMSVHTGKKCVDLALKSPSLNLKFEFQGGEPLLNFEVIREIVEYTKKANSNQPRRIDFVVCTNLTKLTAEHLTFLRDNKICISTSLDGPKEIHDQCRKKRNGEGTYELVIKNLKWAYEYLGKDASALMTVTKSNIDHLDAVIDEYVRVKLPSIFLRMINAHGAALDHWSDVGYGVDKFVSAYEKALNYIIDLNNRGVFFVEEFAALLLTKILTPFSTGFVDLQSPTGAGLGGASYEINGDVFIADEARMLAQKTGDKAFCLGNVYKNTYQSMFCGQKILDIAKSTTIEALPGCAWCVYQPYCGSDPIRCYMEFGNFGLSQSKTEFCKKHRAIFDVLFRLLQNNEDKVIDVFWSWITRRDLSQVRFANLEINEEVCLQA